MSKMRENKCVYEKPSLKVVEVELNECIAASTKISVEKGGNLLEGLNAEWKEKNKVGSNSVFWNDDWDN